jgi:salicylate hydroxylase
VEVSIVGAGIAGLTLAGMLARDGIGCTVYEQAPWLGAVGAGIQVAPNASRILHRLGLAERLSRVAVRPMAIEMRRWDDNQVLARTALGPLCEHFYGAPYYTLHRADLHDALRGLVPAGRIRLAHRAASVSTVDGQAVLRFEDGSVAESDLVIGADGIHSVIRDSLVSDQPRPSGQSIYRALIPADRLYFLRGEPKVVLWLGPEQHAVCYPVAAGRYISFGATAPAGDWNVESWSAQGNAEELRAAYQGWHPNVQRIIEAADSVSRWALHDREPVENWVGDRVAIVGDAAHAMLPFLAQGANQAIEDAAALAGFLRLSPNDLGGALHSYQEARKPRTAQMQRLSLANATVLHLADGSAQQERDAAIREVENLHNKNWLYAYDAEDLAVARSA